MKLSKNKKIVIGVTIVLIALIGWRRVKSKEAQYTEYFVEKQNITQTLELSGEIDAKKYEDLHFLAGGLVTYLPFEEGDTVKRFQTIASLDQRSLKKTLQQYLNTYSKERNDFDTAQDDNQEAIDVGNLNLELRRILDAAQYDLNNSVIDVELQDLVVQLSRLYSPFDGILVKSPITSAHVNVLATDIFTVVDPSTLFFNANLDESDLSKIDASMRVILELDAYPDQQMNSSITYVSYTSKELSTGTTYEVDVPIPEEFLPDLRLGLNGTATIVLSEKANILTLPIEAVTEELDRSYVLVKNNGDVTEVDVKLGISDNNYIEILSGLNEGDKVVIEKK